MLKQALYFVRAAKWMWLWLISNAGNIFPFLGFLFVAWSFYFSHEYLSYFGISEFFNPLESIRLLYQTKYLFQMLFWCLLISVSLLLIVQASFENQETEKNTESKSDIYVPESSYRYFSIKRQYGLKIRISALLILLCSSVACVVFSLYRLIELTPSPISSAQRVLDGYTARYDVQIQGKVENCVSLIALTSDFAYFYDSNLDAKVVAIYPLDKIEKITLKANGAHFSSLFGTLSKEEEKIWNEGLQKACSFTANSQPVKS